MSLLVSPSGTWLLSKQGLVIQKNDRQRLLCSHRLKRAGLDYWDYVVVDVHKVGSTLISAVGCRPMLVTQSVDLSVDPC